MPSSRRPSRVAVLAALALVVAGCSAQPISEVSAGPDTTPGTGTASAAAGSAPPSAVPASTAPSQPPSVAPAGAPPGRPTGTTFAIVSDEPADGGGVKETHRITWEPAGAPADAFLVYGVKTCLRASKKNNGTPCVVKGMRIPRDQLEQLGQAGGSDRSIDVSWVVPKSNVQPYSAILLRATNSAGDSIFAIVHSEDVCWHC
jgi:hypothetical protein